MSEHYIGINFVCPKCAHYHQFFIQVCIQAKRQARNHTQHHLGLNMLYNSMSLTILMPFYATDCTVLLFKVYIVITNRSPFAKYSIAIEAIVGFTFFSAEELPFSAYH